MSARLLLLPSSGITVRAEHYYSLRTRRPRWTLMISHVTEEGETRVYVDGVVSSDSPQAAVTVTPFPWGKS